MIFYTDGSFTTNKPDFYGWAAIGYDEDEIITLSGVDNRFIESRQIGGECDAVIKVLDYCIENNISDIEIRYDYIGVEHWALGTWKRNKPVSQTYHKEFNEKIKLLQQLNQFNFKFTKVKGHSNIYGNELADKAAKNALESV